MVFHIISKIDIEGMDLFALKFLFKYVGRPKYISIDSQKIDVKKLNDELKLFETLGYGDYNLVAQSFIHKEKVPPLSKEGVLISYSFRRVSSGLFGFDLPDNWINKSMAL